MNNVTSHLLSQSAYWRVSKVFVEKLGLIKGFILTDLIDKSEYYKSRRQLTEEGFFFYRREDMIKLYPVGETTLRNILKELSDEQLIQMELKQSGLDRKTFYKIQESNIQQLIEKYLIEKSQNCNTDEL